MSSMHLVFHVHLKECWLLSSNYLMKLPWGKTPLNPLYLTNLWPPRGTQESQWMTNAEWNLLRCASCVFERSSSTKLSQPAAQDKHLEVLKLWWFQQNPSAANRSLTSWMPSANQEPSQSWRAVQLEFRDRESRGKEEKALKGEERIFSFEFLKRRTICSKLCTHVSI